MSTAQHTPGPWHIGEGIYNGNIFAKNGRQKFYHDGCSSRQAVCTIRHGWKAEEDNANARLIAAAPQMLEALRAALEAIGDTYDARDAAGTEGEQLRDQIAEAIATATGEPADY